MARLSTRLSAPTVVRAGFPPHRLGVAWLDACPSLKRGGGGERLTIGPVVFTVALPCPVDR